MKYSRSFLEAIPKTDLHVHLDGSLRLSTLIELAKEHKVELPAYTEEGLKELVFKDHYNDLPEYLHGFKYTVACMKTAEALERIAYELALDNYAEGVCYIEPRFAPQLHSSPDFSVLDVLVAVDKGLSRAKQEINTREEVVSGEKVPFDYGIIGCAMRMFNDKFSRYHHDLSKLHATMPKHELYALASTDLVRELIRARDEKGITSIVAFDLAGAEKGFPAEDHAHAFNIAHKHFLKKTVHAGEAYGPSSIFQAITVCHANRIGHGTNLFDYQLLHHTDENAKKRYVHNLAKYIADQRITIEVCLTSNMQTIPAFADLSKHPLGRMLDERLSLSFCTDNRLVSHTTVTDEIMKATEHFEISPQKLRDLIIYGFKRNFSPLLYPEKRKYMRKVIDAYDKIASQHQL
ncbi:MAG: adenosine deaminase family protein [Deltaproteobacteria bacterium CG_4_10_14_0_2_um_filter_43_8]|nr:MAG: adenosine deaminase [Deltaproteobacteria bacterium CG11_big_fil_rev_8_21_14_0_20_42_23]PJA21562.1 MAG: adenosine deaminase family protein [Deltaproteobacteria bacterium CG_4_10_14_0_2_um_filter_43_8]PJC64896.1 MAG: adenosine deaminase family protein [Deltaproteobacteria bacterium CG_4_9_14_0_2_um_filter_42_21]